MTKLRSLRKEKGISAFELARRTGVHPSTISRIENGKLVPSDRDRQLLLSEFGVEENELFDSDNGLVLRA